MIAHLYGEVVEKTASALIIDVGGVGYEVQVASGDHEAVALNERAKLYTHDHWRENAHELFGFSSLAAKRLFELLISVSGVGPKMALAILSLGDVESIRSAIATSDSAFVQRASGVGKRIAERIAVDLKDKVGLPSKMPVAQNAGIPGVRDDALDALLALGYSLSEAQEALGQLDSQLDTQTKIRLVLQKGIR